MTNVDCHFYVEVFESEEDKDPIAISNIFKFPDDNPDSQVYTDAMDKYIEGMSDGLGVLSVHYRVFRVRGDGVKKFQYAVTIMADEEEREDEVAAVTDSQDEKEPEVADAKSEDEPEEPEQEEDESEKADEVQEDDTKDESEKEDDTEEKDEPEEHEQEEDESDQEDDTEEKDEPEEPDQEEESEKADEQEDETESESEKADEQEDVESEGEDEEDDWPWLTELEGQPASKKNANKFMLGALMNYWMRPEVSWDNAEKLAEDILEDPDDLWGIIADKSDADIKAIFTGPPRLHRFLKMVPEMVHEIATNVVKEYDGDSRKIWKDQDISDIIQRLHDIGVKKQTSSLILWALKESGQIKA